MSKLVLPKFPAVQARPDFAWELPKNALTRWNSGLQAKDEDSTINIYDPIGHDFWGEGVTVKRVAAELRAIGDKQVTVNVNSPGGDVFEGIGIYNLLRDHPRKVTVRVIGLAASAASVIAMGGDEIQIARAGFMMIHNVWVFALGNRNDLREAADILEPFDDALADVYAARAGMDKAEVAKMMDKETWLSGSQAIEKGFADDLLPADQVEEDDEPEAAQAALDVRVIDLALAKQGMPRSERRALLNRYIKTGGTPGAAPQQDRAYPADKLDHGTPRAAVKATQNAGEVEVVQRLTALFAGKAS